MGELFANDRIYDIPMELVPLKKSEKETAGVCKGDLLFARQSLVLEGAGKCSIVMETSSLTVFESHLIRVRLNKTVANPMFYYYYFKSPLSPIKTIVNQCAQAGIRGSDLTDLEVLLPPISAQRRIADILSAYDDLIENNRKQIKLLEEAAQRLYKEWFVDLRFPGWETTEIVDGVPVGWKKARVVDVASLLRRGISPKYNEEGKSWVINQKCIRQTVMDISEARRQEKNFAEEMQLRDSDTVICSTGAGTLGRVGQVFGSYGRTTFDSHVTVVRAKNAVGKQWLFQLLKSHQAYLQGQGKGSTNQLELYRGVIEGLNIFVPPNAIMRSFEDFAQPIHDRITASKDCILRLQKARDLLLPKLMSGELEV